MPTTEIVLDMDTNCTECGQPGTAKNGLCLNCIGKRVVETGDLTSLKKPGNVTKVNSTIQAEVAYIGSVTADFVKGQMVVKLTIKLDESALSVREDLAFFSFDNTPVRVMITSVQGKLI